MVRSGVRSMGRIAGEILVNTLTGNRVGLRMMRRLYPGTDDISFGHFLLIC